MSGKRELWMTAAVAASVSLIVCALTAFLVLSQCGRQQFALLDGFCLTLTEKYPETAELLPDALKFYEESLREADASGQRLSGGGILGEMGYRWDDFYGTSYRLNVFVALAALAAGTALFAFTFIRRNRWEAERIRALAEYLEQINMGKRAVLTVHREDDFSRLEDEIYKTVTSLYQTRDMAVNARNDFAENLANIAHQIKTPITAILLSLQETQRDVRTMREHIARQIRRLMSLEEALLVLSRLDAGTLVFGREKTDVYTLLVLAAENLQELLDASGTTVEIPEQGEMAVTADLDWTMEAVMNLMKNCMEHNPGGTIHCAYEQNPLYTQIRIRDEGEGFSGEDLPHLFERFYRGKRAKGNGIGIGLALAKEIIERQNGTLRAENAPEGGACFEIRFYPDWGDTVTEL